MRSLTLPLVIALALLAAIVAGCSSGNRTADKQRKTAIEERTQAFSRAEHAVPTPKPINFPLRKALAEFTERQDLTNHPWYVYLLGMNGNAVSYYVARTVPINACDFLSSTQDVHQYGDHGDAALALTAPSLDGIYYGGSGSSSGCDSWFFFDSATNALVQIRGVNWYAADQPLRVDAKPIKVAR